MKPYRNLSWEERILMEELGREDFYEDEDIHFIIDERDEHIKAVLEYMGEEDEDGGTD